MTGAGNVGGAGNGNNTRRSDGVRCGAMDREGMSDLIWSAESRQCSHFGAQTVRRRGVRSVRSLLGGKRRKSLIHEYAVHVGKTPGIIVIWIGGKRVGRLETILQPHGDEIHVGARPAFVDVVAGEEV